jgi:hypothetical protein
MGRNLGRLLTILLIRRVHGANVAASVGLYFVAAYWFNTSTPFANPAVTIARAPSDTFAGIRSSDLPYFVLAQMFGGLSAVLICRWLIVPARRKQLWRGFGRLGQIELLAINQQSSEPVSSSRIVSFDMGGNDCAP